MSSQTTFPSDIEACHRLLREQNISLVEKDVVITECRTVIAERDTALAAKDALVAQQNQQLAEYQLRLAAALQAAFKKRIERYLNDPSQLKIDFGDSPDVADAAEGIADAAYEAIDGYERRRQQPQKPRSEQLPAHLPRIELKLPVSDDQKTCPQHGEREVIGYDW